MRGHDAGRPAPKCQAHRQAGHGPHRFLLAGDFQGTRTSCPWVPRVLLCSGLQLGGRAMRGTHGCVPSATHWCILELYEQEERKPHTDPAHPEKGSQGAPWLIPPTGPVSAPSAWVTLYSAYQTGASMRTLWRKVCSGLNTRKAMMLLGNELALTFWVPRIAILLSEAGYRPRTSIKDRKQYISDPVTKSTHSDSFGFWATSFPGLPMVVAGDLQIQSGKRTAHIGV